MPFIPTVSLHEQPLTSTTVDAVPTRTRPFTSSLQIVGPVPLSYISRFLNRVTGNVVPVWNPYMPKGASKVKGECRH